jgi:membrane protease YdiL (CAAX protease family)
MIPDEETTAALSTPKPDLGRPLLLLIILLLNVSGFSRLGNVGNVISVFLLLAAILCQAVSVVHAAALTALLLVGPSFFPRLVYDLPATGFLVPFFLSLVFVLPAAGTRATLSWFKKGTPDLLSWVLSLITGLLATLALIVWAVWTDNLGAGDRMMGTSLQYPFWIVLGVGIPIFALINAVAEEVVYRGVLQEALTRTFDNAALIIFLQASAFAAAHVMTGFPNGIVGYFMVLLYGGVLGFLRFRTRGLLLPYLTHVLADLTIGAFLYFHTLKVI